MLRTRCTLEMGMTTTDTDSGWSSLKAEEAASEEGGQTLAEAEGEEGAEALLPGGASTGSL